jgi:hypothetical protein
MAKQICFEREKHNMSPCTCFVFLILSPLIPFVFQIWAVLNIVTYDLENVF